MASETRVQQFEENGVQQSKGHVLLTGGTGFIAYHILLVLLDHGFSVTTSVRSKEKGKRLISVVPRDYQERVKYVVVEDISKEGAFDQAVQATPPFDNVVHTASPYHLALEDPIRDFLDPAIKGTTGILSSVHAHAPTVKRVVLTSSSAAMLNPLQHAKCYDESFWNPFTFEDVTTPGHELGQYAYPASKKLAEQAAWSFMSTAQPRFTLTVCNPTYTFGPIAPPFPALSSLDNLNTSSHLVRDLVLGRYRDATVLPPTNPVFTFVDVRDIAMAHVRAMTTPAAGGLRFYIVGGHWSVRRIRDILWEEFPDLRERLPPPGRGDDDDLDEGTVYRFDNTRSRNVLGMTYHGLRESIVDAARSVLEFVEKESTACAVLNGTAA